ncbi:MAG: hypothetical protein E6Q67_12505 [Roseateles sp.]|nr:MAG: hypothetical protein E6Q67_12505 [Roseateles sp.]
MDSDSEDGKRRFALVGLKPDPQELLAIDYEPSHFLRRHEGHVTLYTGNSDDDPIDIGRYQAFYVDAEGAVCADVSLHDVLDTTQSTYDYLQLYQPGEGTYTEAVLKAAKADWLYEPNLLILDRLEILPAYRRRGYGLQALIGMMHWFQAGAGLVVMKPFPLQSEASSRRSDEPDLMALSSFTTHHTKARAKLRRYYAQLGFKLVPRTQFMVRRVDQRPPSLPAHLDI